MVPKLELNPVTGCWIWKGRCDSEGYGRHSKLMAHRYVYCDFFATSLHRTIELDHVCRYQGCVFPYHLDPVSKSTNQQRKHMFYLRRITKCPMGHHLPAFDKDWDGRIICVSCLAISSDVLDSYRAGRRLI